VFYNPRVGINVIPKYLVLEAFPDKPFCFSQKRLQWISGQPIETEGILRVVRTKIGEYGIFLDYHIFDIPKGDPPFILIGRPIEGVLSIVLDHEKQPYHLEVRDAHLQCHRPEVMRKHVWSMDILEASTLDSQNRLEHEGFTPEGSQIPCPHQKLPELSSPITNDLYEIYNLVIFLVHANFETKVVDAYVYHKISNFVVIFGTNLAARAMMVLSSRLAAR
jgi:hypothetical protein